MKEMSEEIELSEVLKSLPKNPNTILSFDDYIANLSSKTLTRWELCSRSLIIFEKKMEENFKFTTINNCIIVEEYLNLILGRYLLLRDFDNTMSFGTKSYALSFKAKLNILQDLKLLNKEQIKRFDLIGEVRNKFAHLLIEDITDITNTNKDIKTRLSNCNTDINVTDFKDEESYFRACFLNTTYEAHSILLEIHKELWEKVRCIGNKEICFNALIDEISKEDINQTKLRKIVSELKKNIPDQKIKTTNYSDYWTNTEKSEGYTLRVMKISKKRDVK